MKKEDIKIVNLKDYPEHIEEVSKWVWEEWSKVHGASIDDIIYRTKHSIEDNKIPMMFIALNNNEVVGVVSLWNNDLTARQDLTPWMATLYIKSDYRNQGIGTMLQEKSIEISRSLNYDYLYLITDHVGYYEKTGWKFLELAPLGDGRMTHIYKYNLKG